MKKIMAMALVGGLAFSLMAPTGATARKKPVKTSLFFHGTEDFGEVESYPGAFTGGAFKKMDSKAPEGGGTKSQQILTYGAGPNTNCAGNNLFPVWVGELAGTVKGAVKVTFHTASTPAEVDIRIWPDINALTCNEDYPEPVRELRVALPAGQGKVEATLKGAAFKATQLLMVQISPATTQLPDPVGSRPVPPFLGRVFYDSADMASGIQFKCIPKSGKTCTPPAEAGG